MSDDWEFYPLLVDNKPASIFFDWGIRGSVPLPEYDFSGYLRVKMKIPREDGLSSQDEFDQLINLEDCVCKAVADDNLSIFVGRNTSDGNRDFYFYTKDAETFSAAAKAAMANFPEYNYRAGTRKDPEWRTYLDFLFPRARDKQRIINRKLCDQLEKNGDTLTLSRQIDHLVYFDQEEAAREFIAEIQTIGFTLSRFEAPNDREPRCAVEFSRADKPSDIDQVVLSIYDTAIARKGDYDGWGCNVVK